MRVALVRLLIVHGEHQHKRYLIAGMHVWHALQHELMYGGQAEYVTKGNQSGGLEIAPLIRLYHYPPCICGRACSLLLAAAALLLAGLKFVRSWLLGGSFGTILWACTACRGAGN